MSRYDDLNRQWGDRGERAYGGFTADPLKWAVVAVVVFVLLVGLFVFGKWEAHWWFYNQNLNRESHALRNSYGAQQTLREEITQRIGDVLSIGAQIHEATDPQTQAALRAQAKAILAIVCQDADEVTGDALPADQQAFVKDNCEAGAVSPSSPYNRGTNP